MQAVNGAFSSSNLVGSFKAALHLKRPKIRLHSAYSPHIFEVACPDSGLQKKKRVFDLKAHYEATVQIMNFSI